MASNSESTVAAGTYPEEWGAWARRVAIVVLLVALATILIIPAVIVAAALAGALGTIICVPLVGFAADLVDYVLKKVRGGDPYPGEEEPVFFEGLRGVAAD